MNPPPGTIIHSGAEESKPAPFYVVCATYGDAYALQAREPGIGEARVHQLQDTALKAYQQALQVEPKYIDGYKSLAHLYLEMNDISHAALTYQKLLQLMPNDASLWYEMGVAMLRQKDFTNGLTGLAQATTLDWENREYSNAYGYALARAGQYDQALTAFMRHNDPATAHYNLARMLAHMQQPALSLAQVRMALAANPNLSSARKLEAELQGQPSSPIQTAASRETQVVQPKPAEVAPVQYLAPAGNRDSHSATPIATSPASAAQPVKPDIQTARSQLQPVIFTDPDLPKELTCEADAQFLPPPPMYSLRPSSADSGRR